MNHSSHEEFSNDTVPDPASRDLASQDLGTQDLATQDLATMRIWTVPNALSAVRLVLIPVFVWLVLVAQADGWAVFVLAVSGITDYLDGYLARRLGQISRIGQILDPLVDRLTVAATLIVLALRDIIPWWLVGLLVARELVLVAIVPTLRRHGLVALPIHYLGKAATFVLFWGFPFLLVGAGPDPWQQFFDIAGWAFVIWGVGLYWYGAILYIEQALRIGRSVSRLAANGVD
jgi:cardiolipin synthase (CMP-forming)